MPLIFLGVIYVMKSSEERKAILDSTLQERLGRTRPRRNAEAQP
jgi:hypothetical protein